VASAFLARKQNGSCKRIAPAQRPLLILSLQVKARKSLTIAPGLTLNAPCSGMVIVTILFLPFVAAIGAAIVKIYEWRQDVLYGPYLAKQRSEPNRPR
jgi:hypothetical protein